MPAPFGERGNAGSTEVGDGRALLRAVKARAGAGEAALALPVGRPVQALLRPVATSEAHIAAKDVQALTAWRNRFVTSFLTEFVADVHRTTRWLIETVGREDSRILFMVDDVRDREPIGYMGLAFIDWEAGTGEADAVVRGKDAAPGVMSAALRTMLDWARHQLELTELSVRVRSDNAALEFYRKVGFRETGRVPLRRVDSDAMIGWVEDESVEGAELTLVHMVLAA